MKMTKEDVLRAGICVEQGWTGLDRDAVATAIAAVTTEEEGWFSFKALPGIGRARRVGLWDSQSCEFVPDVFVVDVVATK